MKAAKYDFDNIANAIDNITSQRVEGLQVRQKQITDLDKAIKIEGLFEDCEINQYCNKSGKLITSLSHIDLTSMIKIHGSKRVKYLLHRQAASHISPQWVYTDGKALNELMLHDPLGYFVYAASIVSKCFPAYRDYYLARNTIKGFSTMPELAYTIHADKITLYKALQDCNIGNILQTNELMRQFLSLFQTLKTPIKLNFPSFPTLPDIAANMPVWHKAIREFIISLLKTNIRKGNINRKLNYGDITTLQQAYRGHSSFRSQRKIKAFTDTDMIISYLEPFMQSANAGNDASSSPWKLRKLVERQAKKGIVPIAAKPELVFNPVLKKQSIPTLAEALKSKYNKD